MNNDIVIEAGCDATGLIPIELSGRTDEWNCRMPYPSRVPGGENVLKVVARKLLGRITVLTLLWALVPSMQAQARLLNGAWVQNTDPHRVQVLIEGEKNDRPGRVVYGPSKQYGNHVDLFPYAEPESGRQVFQGVLPDLLPNRLYHYRVDHEGDSRTGSFRTVPTPGQPFAFVVLGDPRTKHAAHEKVVEAILPLVEESGPSLLFNTGDLVGDSDDGAEWDTFFRIEGPLLSKTVFHAVAGNHDLGSRHFYRYFSAHGSNHDRGYYAFKYGNAHFTILLTETACHRTSPQGRWLEKELGEAHADPEIIFKFVFVHNPGVTTGFAHSPEKCITGENGLIDLFEEKNVDVVWAGHNHHYEHTLLNGVHYVTTGCGGQGGAPFDRTSIHTVYKARIHGFSTVRVDPLQYSVDSYKVDPKKGERSAIVDSWSGGPGDVGKAGPTPDEFLPGAGWGMMDPSSKLLLLSGIVILLFLLGRVTVRRRRRRRSAP